jgi:serine protease Do
VKLASRAIALAAVLLGAATVALEGQRRTPLVQLDNAIESLVHDVSPSIVQILVSGIGPVAAPGRTLAVAHEQVIGSGVIVDSAGFIITNAHVVAGAQRVEVIVTPSRTPAGERLPPRGGPPLLLARVVGLDRVTDVAVLKVDTTGLAALPFGDSDRLREGQLVLTFGSPAGLANSVTMGIVSSVAREVDPDRPVVYIQTDAPINPGNSGGGLVSADGALVGINAFILSQSGGSEGLGFAIPSNTAAFVYRQLRAYGHVHRGRIGMTGQEITPVLAKGLGLPRDWGILVADVAPDGPAASAGLQSGDVVVGLNGRPVATLAQFVADVTMGSAGRPVQLDVLRGPATLRVRVPVSEQRDSLDHIISSIDPAHNLVRKIGVLGVAVDPTVAASIPGLRIRSGVLVVAQALDAGSTQTGLAAGDVIHTLNRTPVGTLEDLRAALHVLKSGDAVALGIEREGGLLFLPFELN